MYLNLMKRISHLWGAALAAGMALIIAGCSDSVTDQTNLSFPDGVESQITLSPANNFYSIPVKCGGAWTAKVAFSGASDDELPWLTIFDDEGTGDQQISYVVDANSDFGARTAVVTITSGDQTIDYTIVQNPLGAGDENDAIDYGMFAQTIPLGHAIRMEYSAGQKLVTGAQLFVLKSIAQDQQFPALVDEFFLSPGMYVNKGHLTDVKTTMESGAQLQSQSRDIGAHLKLNISYAAFKLDINGDFRLFGSSTANEITYCTVGNRPVGNYSLDMDAINDDWELLADEEDDDAQTKKKKTKARNCIMSSKFITARANIKKYIAAGEKYVPGQVNNLSKALDQLNKTFGPVFAGSIDVGANADLQFLYRHEEGADTMQIHGDIHFGLNSMFSCDVTASADYNNYMHSKIDKNSLYIGTRGGAFAAGTAMRTEFTNLISQDPSKPADTGALVAALEKWYDSVNIDDPSTFACINYYPTGIWTLFDDEDGSIAVVMEYFRNKYPNRADGSCPYTVDIQAMINGK